MREREREREREYHLVRYSVIIYLPKNREEQNYETYRSPRNFDKIIT